MSTKDVRLLMDIQQQVCPVQKDDYTTRSAIIEHQLGIRINPNKLIRTKPFKKIIYKESLTMSNNQPVWKKRLRKRNVNRN